MTGLFASMLPIALLMTADGAVATDNYKWLDDKRVKVNTTQNIKEMMPDFGKAGKDLKSMAKELCAAKELGKHKIEGEVMVTAIGVTPEGQRQVTLSATYACK